MLTSSFFTFVNSQHSNGEKIWTFLQQFLSFGDSAKNLYQVYESLTLACLVYLFWTLGWGGFFLTKKIFFRGNWWVRPGGLFTNWIMNIVMCIYIRNSKNETRLNFLNNWQSNFQTKQNLKPFLLLWFCIPLLGLVTPEVQTFVPFIFFLTLKIGHW